MRRDFPPGGPRPDPDEEVRQEIEFYLEERARELEGDGMAPDEARAEAERAFGDVQGIERELRRMRRRRQREARGMTMMSWFARDVRVALRGLIKRPGFGAVVIGTLALGIGAVTAIFTVVNAALLRPLPFDEADRLVFLRGAYLAEDGPRIRGASVPEAQDWQERARSFEAMAMLDGVTVNVTGGDGPATRLVAEQVGPGYFETLRLSPRLGRAFTDEEMTPGSSAAVMLLTHALWEARYGADPDIVGRSARLNGQSFDVVGVLPEDFGGVFFNADIVLPLGNPVTGPGAGASRGSRWLSVLARLAPGVQREPAQQEMDGIAAALEADFPDAHEDRIAVVESFRDLFLGSTRTLILVVLAATGLLLLIAAANVANLLLVRASGRGAEMHMRKALGAGRGRIVGQLLTESFVYSAIGALLGLGVGSWGARLLADRTPAALLPSYVDLSPDLTVFVGTAALMAAVGALAGLAPALIASRSEPAQGLRSRGDARGDGSTRLQRALVVGEVALALLLLVGAGLMTRSFRAQLAVSPGFDHERLYGFRVTFPASGYDLDGLLAAAADIDRRLEEEPAIERATYAGDIPLVGGSSASYLYLEGAEPEDRIRFYYHRVAPDWFETLGTDVLQGRALARTDMENPNVMVVARSLVDRFLPGQDPIGASIRLFDPASDGVRVVGVAEDIRYRSLTTDLVAGDDDPHVYVLWDSMPSRTVSFVARTEGDPAALAETVQAVVSGFDPQLPVFTAQPLSQGLAAQTAQARFGTLLLGTFSALATLLALVGLYGVLSFAVDRSRREIAVRMAVGAERGHVRGMVLLRGGRLVAAGLVLGLLASVYLTRWLDTFLFGVETVDVPTYAATTALLVAVATLAIWVPAFRATRVDPQAALKAE